MPSRRGTLSLITAITACEPCPLGVWTARFEAARLGHPVLGLIRGSVRARTSLLTRPKLRLNLLQVASSFLELLIARHRRIPLRRESRDLLAGGESRVGETAPACDSRNSQCQAGLEEPSGPEQWIEHGTPLTQHEVHRFECSGSQHSSAIPRACYIMVKDT